MSPFFSIFAFVKGKLYLIPSPLGEYDPAEVLPAPVLQKACEL